MKTTFIYEKNDIERLIRNDLATRNHKAIKYIFNINHVSGETPFIIQVETEEIPRSTSYMDR